jgi:hypothetical protein
VARGSSQVVGLGPLDPLPKTPDRARASGAASRHGCATAWPLAAAKIPPSTTTSSRGRVQIMDYSTLCGTISQYAFMIVIQYVRARRWQIGPTRIRCQTLVFQLVETLGQRLNNKREAETIEIVGRLKELAARLSTFWKE